MKDLLFLASDLWLMSTCWLFGFKFLRDYGNHLLGLELLVVATSSTNFLVWSLLGGDKSSPLYHVAYALDAFSRSFGITLILVLGLLAVTHRYKPPLAVEVGSFALAAVAGIVLGRLHNDHLHHDALHVGVATFYVVGNLLTALFLMYFAKRVWDIGARSIAIWTALVTVAGSFIAITYDFFPFSFDDNNRTIFYTAALTTWGAQALVYFIAYRALHDHNVATDAVRTREASTAS